MSDNQVFSNPKAPELKHQKMFPVATYSPWHGDAEFGRAYQAVRKHTLVEIYRCYELWTIAEQLGKVEGCFLEVGVWRGGTGALLATVAAKTAPARRVFLADTFTGVVKTGKNDTDYVDGRHSDTSLEIVRDLLASMNLKNCTLLKGIFPEDTASQVTGKIALLHCDVDVYQSAKDVVEWTLPRLSVGGVIIFDDYGFYSCEGVTRYANELRAHKNFFFLHNLNGHAIFIKLRE
jgi:O-methyltransferase